MILEFSVKNFLSVKDEVKLSFVASMLKENYTARNDLVTLSDTGLSVSRGAVIYGANASGKSNILKALAFYKEFITGSFKDSQAGERIDVENFRLNTTSAMQPTLMEAVFSVEDQIVRYGFELDCDKVLEEWLYVRNLKKRAKEVEVFYREGSVIDVHSKFPLIQDLVNKGMIRDNALVLSTSAQFNDATVVRILRAVVRMQVMFCSADDVLWQRALKYLDDESTRARISDFAKCADLGIESISKIDDRVVSNHKQYDDDGRPGQDVMFSFTKNESDGTIKYVSLAYPILEALDNGSLLAIDELDSRLHPLLVRRIIALFNSSETNPHGAQILFTAHDTDLLGSGVFRRDQIWFTQKDGFGATSLFSLAEYKVRNTAPYEKEYLRGKYGATPIIGRLEDVVKNPSYM